MATTAPSPRESTARRAFVSTVVVVAVVVGTLALWKLKLLVALLFVAVTISAAMRPGVEALARHRVPRILGILAHYVALLGLIALFLSLAVPDLTHEVSAGLDAAQAHHTHPDEGIRGTILTNLQRHLRHIPSVGKLVHPAVSVGEEAVAILVGIFFTFAAAAYWLYDRDRAIDLVTSFVPKPKRQLVRDTWVLIDLKLGAFVRGQLVLITFVSTTVSAAFWLIGEPYWLLMGIAVGLLEMIPVVGPLVALLLTVAAGLTVSWHVAAFAGGALLLIRLLEDYLVTPRVLGGAVGLPPLIVMVSAIATATLLGGFYIFLSVPIASLIVTIVDVVVRGVDPAEAEVPTVLFPAKEAEGK
ncbi:MAG TPA: AI-2E family transporter [Gaiellaceae bacterium]|jgi:predicted PurR-regulated permease PerM